MYVCMGGVGHDTSAGRLVGPSVRLLPLCLCVCRKLILRESQPHTNSLKGSMQIDTKCRIDMYAYTSWILSMYVYFSIICLN